MFRRHRSPPGVSPVLLFFSPVAPHRIPWSLTPRCLSGSGCRTAASGRRLGCLSTPDRHGRHAILDRRHDRLGCRGSDCCLPCYVSCIPKPDNQTPLRIAGSTDRAWPGAGCKDVGEGRHSWRVKLCGPSFFAGGESLGMTPGDTHFCPDRSLSPQLQTSDSDFHARAAHQS